MEPQYYNTADVPETAGSPGRAWIADASITIANVSPPSDDVTFYHADMRDGADHISHHIGTIDKDGIVTVTDGHTVDELAMCFLTPSANSWEREQRTMTFGMLKSVLGVTWNDRTTAAFWDAVRDRLRIPTEH